MGLSVGGVLCWGRPLESRPVMFTYDVLWCHLVFKGFVEIVGSRTLRRDFGESRYSREVEWSLSQILVERPGPAGCGEDSRSIEHLLPLWSLWQRLQENVERMMSQESHVKDLFYICIFMFDPQQDRCLIEIPIFNNRWSFTTNIYLYWGRRSRGQVTCRERLKNVHNIRICSKLSKFNLF